MSSINVYFGLASIKILHCTQVESETDHRVKITPPLAHSIDLQLSQKSVDRPRSDGRSVLSRMFCFTPSSIELARGRICLIVVQQRQR